jgi:hypothetical protein
MSSKGDLYELCSHPQHVVDFKAGWLMLGLQLSTATTGKPTKLAVGGISAVRNLGIPGSLRLSRNSELPGHKHVDGVSQQTDQYCSYDCFCPADSFCFIVAMTTLVPRPPYTAEELQRLFPQELELQFVQVLLRHGERSPVSARFQNVCPVRTEIGASLTFTGRSRPILALL